MIFLFEKLKTSNTHTVDKSQNDFCQNFIFPYLLIKTFVHKLPKIKLWKSLWNLISLVSNLMNCYLYCNLIYRQFAYLCNCMFKHYIFLSNDLSTYTNSSHLHSLHIPLVRKESHSDSFFSRSVALWNGLSRGGLPDHYV